MQNKRGVNSQAADYGKICFKEGGPMTKVFETATKVAIREIIENHAKPGKFGYFLSEDQLGSLTAEIYELILTSRSLKSAGDRILSAQFIEEKPRPRPFR